MKITIVILSIICLGLGYLLYKVNDALKNGLH